MLTDIVRLARPHQYIKNFFVVIPPFFAGILNDIEIIKSTIIIFIAFSLVSSAVYIFNDLQDSEADKKHPLKRNRPIAGGNINTLTATVLILFFFLTGLALTIGAVREALLLLTVYIVLNIAYSLKLKHMPILDVFIIASGFVIRLLAGSEVTDVTLSKWIIILTFMLALFLAFAKRYDDLTYYLKTGEKVRKSIDGYSRDFLTAILSVMAGVIFVAYVMYSIEPEISTKFNTEYVYATAIFVLFALLRYLQIVIVEEKSGSPTMVLLKDASIQLSVLFWGLFFLSIIYF